MQDNIESNTLDADDDFDFDTEILHRICQDDKARRELIWLRHMYKGDYDNARDMEQVDPNLHDRLRPTTVRVWKAVRLAPKDSEHSSSMKEMYERLYDERWRHHCAHFASKPCRCIDCAPDRMRVYGD